MFNFVVIQITLWKSLNQQPRFRADLKPRGVDVTSKCKAYESSQKMICRDASQCRCTKPLSHSNFAMYTQWKRYDGRRRPCREVWSASKKKWKIHTKQDNPLKSHHKFAIENLTNFFLLKSPSPLNCILTKNWIRLSDEFPCARFMHLLCMLCLVWSGLWLDKSYPVVEASTNRGTETNGRPQRAIWVYASLYKNKHSSRHIKEHGVSPKWLHYEESTRRPLNCVAKFWGRR